MTCLSPVGGLARRLGLAALMVLLLGGAVRGNAAEINLLQPADTSSPRGLLQDFIATVDAVYTRLTAMMQHYAVSDRLYLTAEERGMLPAVADDAARISRVLDLSQVPPVLKSTVGTEHIIQLKEVLDRIEVPPFIEIPDRPAMERAGLKKWRLPNTEIEIVLVDSGPRAGTYVVSADTVARLPEFYERVKHLPYKPGPAQALINTYRALGATNTSTVFEAYTSSPGPLGVLLPMRWMLQLPDWARLGISGVRVWQWLGLTVVMAFGAALLLAVRRLRRRLAAGRAEGGPGLERAADAAGDLRGARRVAAARMHTAADQRRPGDRRCLYRYQRPVPDGSLDRTRRCQHSCREDRRIRTSAQPQSRQPADPARHALFRSCVRDRVANPGRGRAGLSCLFGIGRARRRRSCRGLGSARQPRQLARLSADHDREAVPRRPYDQRRRQRGHGRGCRVSQHLDPDARTIR